MSKSHLPEGGEKHIDRVLAGKEPYIWWQSTVDSMVRDFTSVVPKAKSSVRGRITGLIQEAERIGYEKSLNGKTVMEAFERGRIAGIREAMEVLRRAIECNNTFGYQNPSAQIDLDTVFSRLESLIQSKSEREGV